MPVFVVESIPPPIITLPQPLPSFKIVILPPFLPGASTVPSYAWAIIAIEVSLMGVVVLIIRKYRSK
jgi:hypothetical protein